MADLLSVGAVTYQQNLYGAQYVHGSSEGGSEVETETHRSSELWTQWSGDHVVRATGFGDSKSRLVRLLTNVFFGILNFIKFGKIIFYILTSTGEDGRSSELFKMLNMLIWFTLSHHLILIDI